MATTRGITTNRRPALQEPSLATGNGNGRSRRPHHTQRQEEILDQLERIFLAEGFRHLTLQDLTNQLHCSRTILYALAPTKEELALMVIDRYLRRLGVAFAVGVERAGTPAERLEAALDALASSIENVNTVFLTDIASYGPSADLHMKHARYAVSRLQAIVTDGIETGAFRPVNAHFAAEVVNMLFLKISDGTLEERTGLSSAEAVLQLKELLFNGLLVGDYNARPRRRAAS